MHLFVYLCIFIAIIWFAAEYIYTWLIQKPVEMSDYRQWLRQLKKL